MKSAKDKRGRLRDGNDEGRGDKENDSGTKKNQEGTRKEKRQMGWKRGGGNRQE